MAKDSGKQAFKTAVCATVGVYAGLCACAIIDGVIKGAITGLASIGNETCQEACDKCGIEYETEE